MRSWKNFKGTAVGCHLQNGIALSFCALLLATSAAAQQPPASRANPQGGDNLADAVFVREKTSNDSSITGTSNPVEMFRGWSQLYKGYDKSPILFDSIRGKTRAYPQAGYNNDPSDKEFKNDYKTEQRDNSLRVLNLGVDDEVNKTSMTMYQPLFMMRDDFVDDINERDRHLDLFQSLRGIAIMTLSYLDKTVAAGLATTQAQADAHTQNQLLKQLNWTAAKLANPERNLLYKDIDDKVEACLLYSSPQVFPKTRRIPINAEVCKPCLSDPRNPTPTSMGQGIYDYCVCCAERMALAPNATVREGTEVGGNASYATSIVARIFLGIEGPTGGPQNKRDAVDSVISNFRRLYGDIVLTPCGTNPYDIGAAPGVKDTQTCDAGNGTLKTEFKFPTYSVADKIKLFRDGLNENCSGGVSDNFSACPLTGTPIDQGICPAIKEILTTWPPRKEDEVKLRRLWVQASLGRIMTGDDINNMFIMMQKEPVELRNQWDSLRKDIKAGAWNTMNPRFKRWLDTYCDGASVSAFKKFHYRMMAITEDHMRMNQRATDYEKSRVRDLMARISSDIELAERDLDSSTVPDRLLAGLDTESDRERIAQMGATSEAQRAAFWNQQMVNRGTLWNWFKPGSQ